MQNHRQFEFLCHFQLSMVEKLLLLAHGGLTQSRHKKIQTNFSDRYQTCIFPVSFVILRQRTFNALRQKCQVLFLSLRHIQRVNAQSIGLVKFLGQFLQGQKIFGLNRWHDAPSHTLSLCFL